MIIKRTIVVRNLIADYPFSGDPSKEWYCEVKDSNLNNESNPKVTAVRQGFITLECLPRHLNAEMIVWFHTPDEAEEVKRLEKVSVIADYAPKFMTNIAFYTLKFMKISTKWMIRFALVSVVLAAVIYFVPTETGIVRTGLERWEKLNAARTALMIKDKTNETIDSMKDELWESEGILELQKRNGLNYKSLFTNYDDNLYVMDTPVLNDDDEIVYWEWDDADDYCQDIGGFLMSIKTAEEVITKNRRIWIKQYKDYPEWTATVKGIMSDDYALLRKKAPLIDGTYEENGVVWGDDGDIKAPFRCALLKEDFVEKTDD